MAVRKVVFYPDSILRELCTDIEDFGSEEFLSLMQDLIDTMSAYGGVGISAPQIGVPKRVFVTAVDERPQYFINPKVVRAEGSITSKEGCLSFPTVFANIERYNEFSMEAVDVDGKEFKCQLDGPDAVAAQHEFDHLNGVLFIDKVSSLTKSFMLKRLKKFKKKFNIV
jgi:peptide deformylase